MLSAFDNLAAWMKALILVVFVLLIGVGFYGGFYSGLEEELATAEQQAKDIQHQIEEAKRREREYLKLTQELAEREVIDRQNKRILPDKAEIPAFLADLNRVAELSGLLIRLVEPRAEKFDEFYSRIPVSLSVTGRFHQLAKFFFTVSRLDRAISLENIRFEKPRLLPSGELVLDAKLLATTFRRASEDGKPAAKKDKKAKK